MALRGLWAAVAATFLTLCAVAQSPTQGVDVYERGEGLAFSQRATGYTLQLRTLAQFSSEVRHFSGTDETHTRFRARRIRLRFSGQSTSQKFSYRLQYELARPEGDGDAISGMLMDGWLAYSPTNRFRLTFGQRASLSDNLEMRTGSQSMQLIERSRLTSAFSTIREFGLFAEGRVRAGSRGWLKLAGSVVTGDGSTAWVAQNHGGLKYEGRMEWLPLGLFRSYGQYRQADLVREVQPRVVATVYGSYNQGVSSRRGRTSGDILYLDANFNEVLPDYWKAGADVMLKYRGWTVIAEWVMADAVVPVDLIQQRVRNDGSIATTFEGGVDAYVRGRMMLGSALNVQAGYVFPSFWSVDARWTKLSPAESSFLLNPTFYGRNGYQEIGVTRYFGRDYGAKIQAGVMRTVAEPYALTTRGNTFDGTEWTFRLMTTFAL
jgi:hypothetical protein